MSNDTRAFDTAEQQADYECLLKELRCVTCPNQSIADSSAPIARAMQDEIYTRLKQQESVQVIREDLIAHYGDYISYNPTLKANTYGLWFGPFVLLLLGGLFWFALLKRKS